MSWIGPGPFYLEEPMSAVWLSGQSLKAIQAKFEPVKKQTEVLRDIIPRLDTKPSLAASSGGLFLTSKRAMPTAAVDVPPVRGECPGGFDPSRFRPKAHLQVLRGIPCPGGRSLSFPSCGFEWRGAPAAGRLHFPHLMGGSDGFSSESRTDLSGDK